MKLITAFEIIAISFGLKYSKNIYYINKSIFYSVDFKTNWDFQLQKKYTLENLALNNSQGLVKPCLLWDILFENNMMIFT